MRLTTKGRFAVTAMLDLAIHAEQRAVSLTSISERQHISLSYLEQLFGKLRRSGLVNSIRGPGGGYVLSQDTSAINIADIIAAVEDTLDATQCKGSASCLDGKPCLAHALWASLNQTIDDYLRNITLQQVLNQQVLSKEYNNSNTHTLKII